MMGLYIGKLIIAPFDILFIDVRNQLTKISPVKIVEYSVGAISIMLVAQRVRKLKLIAITQTQNTSPKRFTKLDFHTPTHTPTHTVNHPTLQTFRTL